MTGVTELPPQTTFAPARPSVPPPIGSIGTAAATVPMFGNAGRQSVPNSFSSSAPASGFGVSATSATSAPTFSPAAVPRSAVAGLGREVAPGPTRAASALTFAAALDPSSPKPMPAARFTPPSDQRISPTAMGFIPNDPFFYPGGDPGLSGVTASTGSNTFPGQWHLKNNMPAFFGNNPAISANLTGAWANNFTGSGITIGIVDDAIEIGHADLAPNNAAVASLNRWFDTSGNAVAGNNPTPDAAGDNHGTAVAGVAAARGGNGIGGSGAAPTANLVGLRTNLSASGLIAAINFANGITPLTTMQVKNHSYGFTAPFLGGGLYLNTPVQNSTTAGTVNVFAAGNNRGNGNATQAAAADSNKISPQNSPFVLTVAALGSDGTYASYSNYGASIFVTAPSNSSFGYVGITTTDRTGSVGYNTNGTNEFLAAAAGGTGLSYTRGFGGTSSASPLVAGVVAVTLSSNPGLLANNATTNQNTLRAVKHLIARTSTVIDAGDVTATSDGGWKTNAAGFKTNQNYGFGLINATKLTEQAPLYFGVTPLTTATSGSITVGTAIPDNSGAGISSTFTMAVPALALQPLEEVVVTLNVTHPNRGNLTAFLTSPLGTRSRLFTSAATGDSVADIAAWQFTMNAFWGENPNGLWSINIADIISANTGAFTNYTVDFRMGDLVPVPEPATLLAGGTVVLVLLRFRLRKPTTVVAT